MAGFNRTCSICGHVWAEQDPGVRYIHGDAVWECADEEQCFTRRAMRQLDRRL